MLLWLEFLICSALIVFSGFKLSRDSEKRSIGRVEYQPRPKSISEAVMKIFHKLTKKKDNHE